MSEEARTSRSELPDLSLSVAGRACYSGLGFPSGVVIRPSDFRSLVESRGQRSGPIIVARIANGGNFGHMIRIIAVSETASKRDDAFGVGKQDSCAGS